MKKIILFMVVLAGAVSLNAQSLKDALYGGKLKLDTGGVIRSNEDFSKKIDTSRKLPVEAPKPQATQANIVGHDSLGNPLVMGKDSVAVPMSVAAGQENAVVSKDNNKIWKDYMDELITTLRTEVLPNKKVKDGVYSVLIEYEINVDGDISVANISASPGSSYLEEQIKQRMTLTAPKLNPLLGTNGKPRKALKKQTITLSK
jgi:hypothetical protein